jgi:hypothetical protein
MIRLGSAVVSAVVLRVSRSMSEIVSDETSATARETRALPLTLARDAPHRSNTREREPRG